MNYVRMNRKIRELIDSKVVNADIGIAVKSEPIQLKGISPHAEKRLKLRGITKEVAQSYIDNSEVMLKQIGNKGALTHTFLSNDGVSAVVVENGMLKTAYSREFFDPAINKIFEVIENERKSES